MKSAGRGVAVRGRGKRAGNPWKACLPPGRRTASPALGECTRPQGTSRERRPAEWSSRDARPGRDVRRTRTGTTTYGRPTRSEVSRVSSLQIAGALGVLAAFVAVQLGMTTTRFARLPGAQPRGLRSARGARGGRAPVRLPAARGCLGRRLGVCPDRPERASLYAMTLTVTFAFSVPGTGATRICPRAVLELAGPARDGEQATAGPRLATSLRT